MEGTLLQRMTRPISAKLMDLMIMRSLRGHFRAVYLHEESRPSPNRPSVVFGNHFYWWDGYLGNLLRARWQVNALAWMEDWRCFPPFHALGALPYPPDQPLLRAKTVRATLRKLQSTSDTLFLFPEGILHTGETLLPFQRSLYWLRCHLPRVQLLPWAIWLDSQAHQYPVVYMRVGKPFECDLETESHWLEQARHTLTELLHALKSSALQSEDPVSSPFEKILEGRSSINERWYAQWGKRR